jgi:Tol biopolymer transport system component
MNNPGFFRFHNFINFAPLNPKYERMKLIKLFSLLTVTVLLAACQPKSGTSNPNPDADSLAAADTLRYPQERHLHNVRQLTFGGNNAEAYWSFDGKALSFQSDYADWGFACDQIVYMPLSGAGPDRPPLVSTGKGRTTCAYFMPDNQHIVYASTHLVEDSCPPTPRRSATGKYVWPVYKSYDIFIADLQGNITARLTDSPGYDAEATVSPDGQKIVFTSTRSGDLELWTMNPDGSDLRQITSDLGYDGGAFFSPDSKKLVWRASRPQTPEAQKEYKDLLEQGLVEPTDLEIFIADADGSNVQQVTKIGKANWAPSWHPSGKKIIFASNNKSESGRQFNLYLVNLDGSGLEQVSFDEGFDAFPLFSPDGKKIAFSSNRFNGGGYDTNVFVADWEE